MTAKNPFPGMNPYFEQSWRDAHTSLITYMRDALQVRLPADLRVQAEEQAVSLEVGERATNYVPDIQIREPWVLKEPAVAELPPPAPPPPPTTAAEPIRVFLDEEEFTRWLEIHDRAGRLITVLELLSPSNKLDSEERSRYQRKRRTWIRGGVSLVELDLVRQGTSVFPRNVREVLDHAAARYGICVCRAARPGEREVYPIRLRDPLPAIAVPLRPTDADVVLELQPLIDQCHERGRYHLVDYRVELDPPLQPDEAAWVAERLREHGLR